MLSNRGKPVEILLVEDDPAAVRLTKEALRIGKIHNGLIDVPDGVEALKYLRGLGEYAGRTMPDLVLLDLNMPRKDGREVLAEMKADDCLKRLPVVILTTSDAEKDILACYDLHANCFVQKPLGFDQFVEAIKTIGNFWFSIVTLPTIEEA